MNKPSFKSWSAPLRTVAVAVAVVSAAIPLMAQSQDSSAREIYQQERADCMAGNTSQSKADCLYEARSALRDRLNGDPGLSDGDETAATSPTSPVVAATSTETASELPAQADRN